MREWNAVSHALVSMGARPSRRSQGTAIELDAVAVGDRCHAVRIRSAEVDYRYDTSGNASAESFTLPDDVAARWVAVTRAFGLELSGIDLIQSDDDGALYCLEVNPMPGYNGYDHTLGHAISDRLVEHLPV